MPSTDAVVLVGPMGAGKTSVGRRVARMLGEGFTDTDAVIVDRHGPIDAIFTTSGEDRFRVFEREAVRNALAAGGVVSLGGGAVLDADTRADLTRHHVVFLRVSPEAVAARLKDTKRPLLQSADPLVRWQRIFEARLPLYEEVADTTFDTSRRPMTAIAEEVAEWVQTARRA
jgi:shikimate kinase